MDLEALGVLSRKIPGMITPQSGKLIYTMCYMQECEGDVVEVGSWQGRSTSFLARAVQNSNNGNFYAIDHFRGNVGKDKFYKVGKSDLSDLKDNFIANMKRLDLWRHLQLLDMPNEVAAAQLEDIRIRFLFIDGDHSREGVQRDIDLFFPKLVPGAIVVFDDFCEHASGLLETIDTLMDAGDFTRVMSYQNTLVLKCGIPQRSATGA